MHGFNLGFGIRRPLIWALGIMLVALFVMNACGRPVFYRTTLDDAMGLTKCGENSAQLEGESSSTQASVVAVVNNITKSETGYKVTLSDCEVEIESEDAGEKPAAEDGGESTLEDGRESSTYAPHGVVAYFDSVEGLMVGDKISTSGKLRCIDRPDNPRRVRQLAI